DQHENRDAFPSPAELAEVVVCVQPSPAHPLSARKGTKVWVNSAFEFRASKTRSECNRALPVRFEIIQTPIQPALIDLGTGRHAFGPLER
ncbi:MAG TPA: hypothetical protein VHT28_10705, partial [Silvibacterium sp.]|nr:hypothetical protein [Silvibacterium sp.]